MLLQCDFRRSDLNEENASFARRRHSLVDNWGPDGKAEPFRTSSGEAGGDAVLLGELALLSVKQRKFLRYHRFLYEEDCNARRHPDVAIDAYRGSR